MIAYLNDVKALFLDKGNPDIAPMQAKYMRNQFSYYGLKAPVWTELTRQVLKEKGLPKGEDLQTLVRLCFEEEYRELHYFSLELVQRSIKKQEEGFIHFLEELITTKSWWDTVDWLANKMVGLHLRRFPSLIPAAPDRWIESDNIWLQRTALLFQLKYKQDTNAELLFRYILRRADSKEFFIQKGAGWALREYSKTAPQTVVTFIESHQLPALTKREGLKWVNR